MYFNSRETVKVVKLLNLAGSGKVDREADFPPRT